MGGRECLRFTRCPGCVNAIERAPKVSAWAFAPAATFPVVFCSVRIKLGLLDNDDIPRVVESGKTATDAGRG